MQAQSSADAKQSLLLLQRHLSPVELALLNRLADQVDMAGPGTSTGAAEALLFPDVTNTATRTKKLSDLVKRYNAAAESAGSPARLKINGGKKAGKDGRFLSFVGPATLASGADMPDLAGLANRRLIPQRGQPTRPVVLITVNSNETTALLDVFLGSQEHRQIRIGNLLYDQLDVHGGFEILHITTEMGSSTPGASQDRVRDVIDAVNPVAVIAVGIAFGMDAEKQNFGDVLVATELAPYERQRVGAQEIRPRNPRVPASVRWVQRSRAADSKWSRQPAVSWPAVRFGLLLSGEKLVDNRKFREQLRKLVGGEAIGGEMEGAGLYAATHDRHVDWLVVKGICDFAENKGEDKQARQQLAARNAALVARATIDHEWDLGRYKLAPTSSEAMGLRELAELRCLMASRAKLVSLAKSMAPESNSELAAAASAGVDVHGYLMNWLEQPDAVPRFALLGEYGMGKTICCQNLVNEVERLRRTTQPDLPVPLYFDLRNLTNLRRRVPTLDEILQECVDRGWNRQSGLVPKIEQIHALVREGALVVFDGLDEALVHLRESEGQAFTQELLRILPSTASATKSRSRLLISCRTHYFRSLGDQQNHFGGQERGDVRDRRFEALVLLPLDEEQVAAYLKAALPERDVDEVIALVSSVHDLTEMTQRPYTLRLIGELLPDIERLRARKGVRFYGVSLYREMVNRWLQRDDGKHHLRPEHKLRLAAYLARELWCRGQRQLPAGEIESWFHIWRASQPDLAARYANVEPDWLDEDLRTATFLVREDGATPEASGFRFAHSSLQEYFLAEYLYRAIRQNERQAWAMPVPSQETLRFLGQLIGEANDPADIKTLSAWARTYLAQASELLLLYANHARLEQPPLPCPSLIGMDLSGAQLADCSLGSEDEQVPIWDLGDLQLAKANLRKARMYRLKLEKANLSGARLDHAEWLGGSAQDCSFSSAKLCATQFRNLDLTGADWTDADAYYTNFLLCRSAPSHFPLARLAPDNERQHSNFDRLVSAHHRASIGACAWSRDGKRILTASYDHSLRIWNAISGVPIRTLEGHHSAVTGCAWSPDGQRILSASHDRSLRIWDAISGVPIRTLEGHYGAVTACAWSPDGQRILSASEDRSLRIWDAISGAPIRTLKGHQGTVTACAWSPDGQRALSASQDRSLRIWDTLNGETTFFFDEHESTVIDCAWSPDGQRILSVSYDETLRIWDSITGATILTIQEDYSAVTACSWSPDGRRILSASEDRSLRILDAITGAPIVMLEGHSTWITACAWSPDGQRILSASHDRSLRIWDAKTGALEFIQDGDDTWVTACAWSPDGKSFLSACEDRSLRVWDTISGAPILAFGVPGTWTRACAWSPDGQHILCASDDFSLQIYDAITSAPILTFEAHDGTINACAWSPDGRRILSASNDDTVRIWDASSGTPILTFKKHDSSVTACAWSPDGQRILSASRDHSLRIWDASSGEPILTLRHELMVVACAWSPDGQRVASASGCALRVWDATSGASILTIEERSSTITACAWSPDGQRILSATEHGVLRIWDAVGGEPTLKLEGHGSKVVVCGWSPDGDRILSVSQDGSLRVWKAENGAELYRVLHTDNGHALIRGNRIEAADGDIWRELSWQVPDGRGGYEILPAETFGELPAWPALPQPRQQTAT